MPKKQQHYKTIVLSDIHLGSKWSKTKEVTRFLKQHSCDTLVLCGDIIDGWSLMRGKNSKWRRRHTNFIKVLLDISHDTKIIYVRGNHDDFLDRVIPLTFSNISVVKDYIYTSGDKRYYVLHGDVFDKVTSSMSWLELNFPVPKNRRDSNSFPAMISFSIVLSILFIVCLFLLFLLACSYFFFLAAKRKR